MGEDLAAFRLYRLYITYLSINPVWGFTAAMTRVYLQYVYGLHHGAHTVLSLFWLLTLRQPVALYGPSQ